MMKSFKICINCEYNRNMYYNNIYFVYRKSILPELNKIYICFRNRLDVIRPKSLGFTIFTRAGFVLNAPIYFIEQHGIT